MLTLARIGLALLGTGAVATAALVLRTDAPEEVVGLRADRAPAPSRLPDASIDLAAVARYTTPFRPGHRPPDERYGAPPVVMASAPPPAPKPALALSGILWGREPAAIVEGVPGQETPVVLRSGETIGPLRVVRIEPGRVVIRGLDTTWTLTVREPWH